MEIRYEAQNKWFMWFNRLFLFFSAGFVYILCVFGFLFFFSLSQVPNSNVLQQTMPQCPVMMMTIVYRLVVYSPYRLNSSVMSNEKKTIHTNGISSKWKFPVWRYKLDGVFVLTFILKFIELATYVTSRTPISLALCVTACTSMCA